MRPEFFRQSFKISKYDIYGNTNTDEMLTIFNAINIIKLQSYTFDEVMLNSGFNVPITSKQRSYLHIIAPLKDIIRKISKPQTDTLKRQILEETNLLQLNATRIENDNQKVINIIILPIDKAMKLL